MNTRDVGVLGEKIAGLFLALKGYQIVARNYRYAGREVDLIATRGNILAAVEVKLRRSKRFGEAVEAVDARKLARIQTALANVIARSDGRYEPRIDLVVIDVDANSGDMTVRHLEAVR